MTARLTARLLGALVVASSFALAITKIDDPDAWTHLALGREMVTRGGFPPHEPFSFPSGAMPYYNTEWLFDVGLYLASLGAGFAGVIVLKAAIVGLAAWILWKDSTLPEAGVPERPPSRLQLVLAAAVVLAVMLASRHRFVERPDVALMVFVAVTIYALNAYLATGRRYLYLLPAVQVVWVNVHPSAIVGAVPFLAVLGSGVFLRVLARGRGTEPPGTPSAAQLRTIALVFVAVLAASLLNPYGLDALTLPLRLATTPWFTQEIGELQPPRFGERPAPFVMVALVTLTLLLRIRRLPLAPALLVAPFAYLGLSGVRFIFLLAIVAGPVIARNLGALAAGLPGVVAPRLALGGAAAALVVATGVTGLALAGVPPVADPRKVAGLGADERHVPEGALRYLDRIGERGRLFNVFHFGGYLEWRDFPRRAPIIDGRGYVPPGLLEEIHFARVYPHHLERLRGAYGFEVAVVDYPIYSGAGLEEVAPGADAALTSPDWALVYWDDVALVYLRRSGRLAAVIERDGYRRVKPANGAAFLVRTLAEAGAGPAVDAELRRNVRETGSSLGAMLLGFSRLEAGADDEAVDAFHRVGPGSARADALQGLALAAWRRGDRRQAVGYYLKVVDASSDATVLYQLGRLSLELGRDREAIRYLERARRQNPRLALVYPALFEGYRRTGGAAEREPELAAAHGDAVRAGQAEQRARLARELQRAGRSSEAITELTAALQLDPRNARARSDLGYVYFHLGRLDEAQAEQRRALALDPRLAAAHYALAEIDDQRGDRAAARRPFQDFVRLEPRSYLAWRVRQTLAP